MSVCRGVTLLAGLVAVWLTAGDVLPAEHRPATRPGAGGKIKAVLVTGGHGFDRKKFLALFEGLDDVAVVHAPQKDHSELFEDVSEWKYDVIVLFNMTRRISPKRRRNFLKLLDRGVGVVALHHSLAAWGDWPEFRKIIGGKWFTRPTVAEGVKHPAGGYKHGVTFQIKVAEKTHPVTAGLKDFQVTDETYCRYWVDPDATVLLTTDHPSSDKALAWAKTFRKARTVYVQMGHGTSIYADANYRRLVANAIRWTAGRQPAGKATGRPPGPKLKAVLWIGGFAHDFEGIARALTEALPKRIPIQIKVVRDGSFLDSPQAKALDVILMNHCHKAAKGVLTDRQKARLLELVRGGIGVVALHASYYSFARWEEYRKLYGTTFTRHGSSNVTLVVRMVDRTHPIAKGLDESFEVRSELYESKPLAADCRVLARAREKDKPQEHPSVWTRSYGRGRVVTILPAHWPQAYQVAGFQKLIAASTLWAAGRGGPAEKEKVQPPAKKDAR